MAQCLPDDLGDDVSATEQQLRDLLQQRRVVQANLRNQKKRQSRLVKKAGGLTDAQLLSIISSRAATAKAKAKAKGKAKAKAKA